MALSLENPNLVRQKVYAALSGTNNPSAQHRVWWNTAREFFRNWVTEGANANLEFVPFADADITAAGGYDTGVDAACKVYLFYINKRSNATAAVAKLFDNITGDSVTTEQTLTMPLDASAQETMQVYPIGFSHATGLVVAAHTTPEGATQSTAGDSGDGFVVIGAA